MTITSVSCQNLTTMPMLKHIEAAIEALDYPARPQGLYEPIRYILAGGGKRLRPMLLLTTYSLYREDYVRALSAAVGIEMYHNHTLVHDDVMDRADMRRGRETVHKKWDDNTAILSGDAMLLLAHKLISSTGIGRWHEALSLFTNSALEICEGQQYDVDFEQDTRVTEAEYIEMIRLKTSVLLGCATKMGALLADAPADDCDVLYSFAEKVGLGFQLQDDYLDAFGDFEVFGKKIGGDILCGKKTFLVHAATAQMTADEAQTFLQKLSTPVGDTSGLYASESEKINDIMAVYTRYNVAERCQQRIVSYFEEAENELSRLSVDCTPLRDYVLPLLHRNK